MSPALRRTLAALGAATLCATAPGAQAERTGLRPAEEHAVRSDREDVQRLDERAQERASQPTNELEGRHYFRDLPDAVGKRARSEQQALIEELLEDRERQVRERRKEAIALLERFIEREPESAPQMPDALLRLAELRWEQSRQEYLQAFAEWQAASKQVRRPQPPLPDYTRAISLYDRLIEKHPDYARLDLVLYMKAFALMERGEQSAALGLYERILSDFPNSRFRPDAHMAKAEYIFNVHGDYAGALQQYNRVLDYEQTELYDLALFKSAWCLWRLDRKKQASVRFRRVLDLDGERARGQRRRRLRDLQDEALEYLIQVFTEDEKNRAADVRRFLQEIGGEQHVERVLRRLSATYYDQARFDRAVEAYELLLSINPADRRAPDYQLAIARAEMLQDHFDEALTAYAKLAEEYTPGSDWASQQGDPDRVAETEERVERALREQGLKPHELGQQDDRERYFERAAAVYEVYLEHFDEHPESYRLTFYLGEILFHRLQRPADAGEAYMRAARKKPEGEFTKDALYNAIGAFERVRESELEKCRPGKDSQGACPETENDQKFSAAIELYAELYPNDPDLPEILFRQGKLYYDRRVYDAAVRLFGQLLERFPKSEYATTAGELILDSFNRAQDYENIEAWARKLKETPAFRSPENQKRLNGLILGAVFKIGEQLAEKGEHARAADAYVRAAGEFPKDPRAAKAYYNAGVERQRAGDLEGAEKAYGALIAQHPGSEEGAQGAWRAAQMFESIAQFGDAARFYEAYGKRFPKAPKAPDALYNAVLLRVSAGDDEKAVAAGRRFLKRFPRHESVDDVHFLVGKAHEQGGRPRKAVQTYRRYLSRARDLDRKVEAQARLGQVLLEAGDHKGADRALSAAVALGKKHRGRLDDGLYFAAQARYLQGDAALEAFEAVSIEGDPRGLSARLQKKAKLLSTAANIYADVVQFQVAEWVTAALFKVGRIYELFAEALNAAPVPEELSEEEAQVYRDELMRFVIPIEERALEAYEGGYRKALELGIYNTWTGKLREGLTRLNDIEYPPIREMGGDIATGTRLPQPAVLRGLARGSSKQEQQETER